MKNFKFTISGNKYEVNIENFEGNIAELEVNGTKYKVEVEHEMPTKKTPVLVRKPVAISEGSDKIQKQPSSGLTKVAAPLPGVIMKVAIAVGASVKKGDSLLIMEAMKMENNIQAEKDGVVKNILIKEGDNVLQGDILIEIE